MAEPMPYHLAQIQFSDRRSIQAWVPPRQSRETERQALNFLRFALCAFVTGN